MTALHAGSCTLVGRVRTANEDAVLVADDLAAVADGMGGHQAGEVASAETVAVVGAATGTRSIEQLVAAVHRANRTVNLRAAADTELHGMGTTVCVVGLVDHDGIDQIAILNVGDSRVYLFADGQLTRLTEDHSLVEALVREGRLTAEEAEIHPQRNVLTRALGVEPLVVVDAWLLLPADGDRLLLCSDGLFNEIGEDRIAELLAEGDAPEVVARRLAVEAEAAGGKDNISTVVVDVTGTGQARTPIGDRYRRITTPAVDLSDPDGDGPRTDTVLAVVEPNPEDNPDDLVDDPLIEDPLVEEADVEEPSDEDGFEAGSVRPVEMDAAENTHRSRWRTLVFVVAIVGVILLAVSAILITSRRGYYVHTDRGVVTLYQGQPILGVQPSNRLGLPRIVVADLTPADAKAVEDGRTFDEESDARRFVDNLVTTTTTTTPTTTTTTTTTVVVPLTPAPVTGP